MSAHFPPGWRNGEIKINMEFLIHDICPYDTLPNFLLSQTWSKTHNKITSKSVNSIKHLDIKP